MTVLSSEVADALASVWRALASSQESGICHEVEGAGLYATGIPLADLNHLLVTDTAARPSAVAALLSEAAEHDLPLIVEARPGMGGEVRAMLAARGYQGDTRVPAMVLENAAALAAPPEAAGLAVEAVGADRLGEHVAVVATGFSIPEEHVTRLVSPTLLENGGIRVYVGSLDGEAVSTAIGFTEGDHVGVFSVATDPAHRRRGFGAALTARAVTDGLEAGAEWAYLQSSESGNGVYEQLGFRTVERWWWLQQRAGD